MHQVISLIHNVLDEKMPEKPRGAKPPCKAHNQDVRHGVQRRLTKICFSYISERILKPIPMSSDITIKSVPMNNVMVAEEKSLSHNFHGKYFSFTVEFAKCN